MTKWYNEVGNQGDVVLNTGVRYARNFSEYPFPSKLDSADRDKINEIVKRIIFETYGDEFGYVDMNSLDYLQKVSMAERHIISPEFATKDGNYGLVLSKDESTGIMICEEDHIRIKTMKSGLNLEEAHEKADDIERMLDEKIGFAFNEKIGYLTQSPQDLGTAMRASVMLHLPALKEMGRISRLANTISTLGLIIRPEFGTRGRCVGDIYQISNQITLGITEETAITNLKAIVMQLISQEKTAAAQLINDAGQQDKIYRSYGILQNARILAFDEFMDMISTVRFGSAMGLLDVPVEITNALIIGAQPATISVTNGAENTQRARDEARATIVREALKS